MSISKEPNKSFLSFEILINFGWDYIYKGKNIQREPESFIIFWLVSIPSFNHKYKLIILHNFRKYLTQYNLHKNYFPEQKNVCTTCSLHTMQPS